MAICLGVGLLGPMPGTAVHAHATVVRGATADAPMKMDCCPTKKPPAPECPHCPLMALCASVLAETAKVFTLMPPVHRTTTVMLPAEEPFRFGRNVSPLQRPPRSLV